MSNICHHLPISFPVNQKRGLLKVLLFGSLCSLVNLIFEQSRCLLGTKPPKKSLQPPPPAKYCWVTIPSYNSFFCLVVILVYMHACIFDMYSGNKLAVLSSVSRLGLVLPIQMTGGSKPVAEAWKTCVHVKRSYSWLAPRGLTMAKVTCFGWWFIRDSGLMTLRQQFKISRDQISRLKIINHKVRICKD